MVFLTQYPVVNTIIKDVIGVNTTVAVASGMQSSLLRLNEELRDGYLVERACFADFNVSLGNVMASKKNKALLVYGPRGCGKSAMIQAEFQVISVTATLLCSRELPRCLCHIRCGANLSRSVYAHEQNRIGVIQFDYEGNGMDFSEQLLQRLLLLATSTNPKMLTVPSAISVAALLQYYKASNDNQRAVIVVDLNSDLTADSLKNVLLAIKALGYEQKLAQFILCISASRSAPGMAIDIKQLRVQGYKNP
jgi:hypothetical protein